MEHSHYFDLDKAKLYHNDGRVLEIGRPEDFLDINAAIKRIQNFLRRKQVIKAHETIWVNV